MISEIIGRIGDAIGDLEVTAGPILSNDNRAALLLLSQRLDAVRNRQPPAPNEVVVALLTAVVDLRPMDRKDRMAFAGVEGDGWIAHRDDATVVYDEKRGILEIYGGQYDDCDSSVLFQLEQPSLEETPVDVMDLQWSAGDDQFSKGQGWILSERDNGKWEIQKIDGGSIFNSDMEAVGFVFRHRDDVVQNYIYKRALELDGMDVERGTEGLEDHAR